MTVFSTKRIALTAAAATLATMAVACSSTSVTPSSTPSAHATPRASKTTAITAHAPVIPKPVKLPDAAPSMPQDITAQQICTILDGLAKVPYKPATTIPDPSDRSCEIDAQGFDRDHRTYSSYNLGLQIVYIAPQLDPKSYYESQIRTDRASMVPGEKITILNSWAYLNLISGNGVYDANWVTSNALVVLRVEQSGVNSLAQPTVTMTAVYKALQTVH